MGDVIIGLGALAALVWHWLSHRHDGSARPELPWEPQERELKAKGLEPGRDFYIFVREGRKPVVRLRPEGRRRLRQLQKKNDRRKKRGFHLFDD